MEESGLTSDKAGDSERFEDLLEEMIKLLAYLLAGSEGLDKHVGRRRGERRQKEGVGEVGSAGPDLIKGLQILPQGFGAKAQVIVGRVEKLFELG
jgi:hypothetical protein